MKLLIDSADVEKIKKISEYFIIDGVTTNPTLLSKAGRPPYEVISEIRDILGPEKEIHVQVISKMAEDMVSEAKHIAGKIGGNLLIKIPAVPEGFKAMKLLLESDIRITATAVFSPAQALFSANGRAAYVAPYVNRLDQMGYDGVELAETIQDLFDNNDYETEVLAASFHSTRQVMELATYGIGAATLSPEMYGQLASNITASDAVDKFVADFEKLTGPGKTMLEDC